MNASSKKASARHKLREFFLKNVGVVVDSNTLREVGGISEWARRVRELRNLEGMNIHTHNDDSALKPGQYKLVDLKRLPVIDAGVSKEMRAFILDRNGFTCQMCGVAAGEIHPFDGRPVRLHIGHIQDAMHGGRSDDPNNLKALCSVCNEGAATFTLPRPIFSQIKAQVNRATKSEQLEILKWLILKFPNQSNALIQGIEHPGAQTPSES